MHKILKILCAKERLGKIYLYKIYNKIAREEGITGYGIRRSCQYAKESSKSYPNMTMKEWFYWATIECRQLSKSKEEDENEKKDI